ncbi:MAG: AsmA family protein, partial [Candidatus Gastranaerophilales bacterium]|nr:AsmA family protein [Candidatus Gastranaerophilales bacterium]
MKKKIFKIIYISIFSVLVLESAYLFVVPVFLNKYINEAYIESVSAQKTNVIISCKNSKIKTHILPYLSFSLSNLIIKDKQNGDIILNGENLSAKIALFPLIKKKINIKSSAADNIEIFITKDENGIYNFLELFPSNDKKGFKTECKNTNLLLNRLQITENDKSF